MQGDENVVAIAQQIVKVLSTSENPTDDMIKFLSDLKISISASGTTEGLGNTRRMDEVDEQLNSLYQKIMNWNSDRSMIWERGVDEAAEYVQAVEEIRRLIESLGCLSLNRYREKDELLQRAHSILQMAMSRLEEEFSHILIENRQPLEPEHLSFRSSDDDVSFVDSIASMDDEPSEDPQVRMQRDNTRGLEEYIIDLVQPHVIPDLKCIAEVMFVSGYDAECCQAYISIRKDALDECLLMLEVEKQSIEDVLQMDWSSLNSKIRKWVRAMKIFVRVYLTSEKSLADQVFGVSGSVSQNCFVEASKSLILQLLSFGEAVAIRHHSPEKIFRILHMYDGFADLLPDIDALFSDEAGSCVSTEAHEVLSRLGDSVRRSINEFKNAVRTNESSTPFAGGAVHHLTRYVVNYLRALIDYSDTLNVLLEGGGDDHSPSSSNVKMADEDDSEWSSSSSSPMARCLQSVISILESNLQSKSQLYTDVSLRHFFLMNNICYMSQKVKDSELGPLMGENWIRKHNGKFQQHAVNYERASWNPVLSFLRDEGICNPKSGLVHKAILKEKFQGFNLSLEDIYRTQTAWLIHSDQLREDLRISISLKVLQAYRTFVGRYSNHLAGERHSDRYIKYSVEDLQEFLLDLFEGSPRSLHKSHRR
ncbi:hypothetical protein ACLOJK_035607 [Asimina triloba]